MKKRFRKLKITTWILFVLVNIVILYESLVPNNLSVATLFQQVALMINNTLNPTIIIPIEKIEILNKKDFYQAGTNFKLEYKVYPENATDKTVDIENLTPDLLYLSNNINFKCLNRIENPTEGKAQVKITSKTDKNIFTLYEFCVKKILPDKIILVKDSSLEKIDGKTDTYKITTGNEIFVNFINYYQNNKTINTLVEKFDYETSENISCAMNNRFFATKKGIGYIIAYCKNDHSIFKKINFEIFDSLVPIEEPDDIIVTDKHGNLIDETEDMIVKKTYKIYVGKNGKKLDVPCILTSNRTISADLNIGQLIYYNNGINEITAYLPTFDKYIKRTFIVKHILKEPEFVGNDEWNSETLTIRVCQNKTNSIKINWPKDNTCNFMTYINPNQNNFTVDIIDNEITIKGLIPSTSYFCLQSKLNSTKIQEPLQFKINVIVYRGIVEDQNKFINIVRKGFGHMLGFFIDSLLFSILIILYKFDKKPMIWLLTALPTGFVFGGLSELLQLIPKRGACFKDVLIDYSGWLLGLILVYLISSFVYLIKHIRNNKIKN